MSIENKIGNTGAGTRPPRLGKKITFFWLMLTDRQRENWFYYTAG